MPAPSRQLVLELAAPEPPSFANFLIGANGEVVEALTRISNGALAETGLLIWGATGAGKSHVLQASVAACVARGRAGLYLPHPERLLEHDDAELRMAVLIGIDRVDTASADAQARLFTTFNAARAAGRHLLMASRVPPRAMELRDDLRTRIGWGLVYELVALADEDKPAALIAYARQRGFRLADDVVRYLLAHGRRDMTTLLATLTALDRASLAQKRAVTVPMLREWMQRDMHGDGDAE